MRSCIRTLFLGLLLILAVPCLLAAPFQNLDFEEANTNNLVFDAQFGGLAAPITDLLPGWRLVLTTPPSSPGSQSLTNVVSTIGFNSPGITNAILTTGNPVPEGLEPKTGNYSLYLQAVTLHSPSPYSDGTITLSQTGDVPGWATDLRLNGRFLSAYPLGGSIVASMNNIPLQQEPSLSGALTYNISPFTGQTVNLQLEFSDSFVGLDSVEFIPEPPTLALLIVGLLLLVRGKARASDNWHRHKTQEPY